MHRRSNAAWVSPQAVSPDFTYVRSREGFNLPQLVDSPNRSSRSSYSRTARWQGNADLWAVAVRMQSAGRREPGPPPGELGRVGQGAPTGRTGPTSGRHSGSAGPRAVQEVRLHGAQARGPQRCERCLPLQCTDHAERGDSRREGATSEQGSKPPPAMRRASCSTGARRALGRRCRMVRVPRACSFTATGGRSVFPYPTPRHGGQRPRFARNRHPPSTGCASLGCVSGREYEKHGLVVPRLVGVDQRLGQIRGDGVVVGKLHVETAAPPGKGGQRRLVGEHLGHGRLRRDRGL